MVRQDRIQKTSILRMEHIVIVMLMLAIGLGIAFIVEFLSQIKMKAESKLKMKARI